MVSSLASRWSLSASAIFVVLAFGRSGSGQSALPAFEPEAGRERIESLEPTVSVAFEGVVHYPDGAPAEGAVVVSSAGGEAVTNSNGAYQLEVQVPVEAESIQITAAARSGENLLASTLAPLAAGAGPVPVAPLHLAQGGTCSPSWLPTFGLKPGIGGYSGAPNTVFDLTVFDDGSGPALYAGGYFTTAGSTAVSHIARWNGSSWAALGSGVNDSVYSLTVFDDGDGTALYAGGRFTTAGGVAANLIAKWDGSSWGPLGSGLNGSFSSYGVAAMTVFDDGSGPALYVGGNFTSAGGLWAKNFAKWDGSSWTTPSWVSLGFQGGSVLALLVIDDGGTPALCVGGSFDTAGGVATNNIATWNGSSWATLGSGTNGGIDALAVFDDGSGPALHAGGTFTTAGGVAANRVAKWDGSSWAPLGSGLGNNWADDLEVFDDGTGPALYAAGGFWTAGGVPASTIAKWDGSSWAPLGNGLSEGGGAWCNALAVFDDGSGAALYAGGDFATAGGEVANNIAQWNGSSWATLGSGLDSPVGPLVALDDGSGPAIYAGGGFTIPLGGFAANNLAKWDGTSWTALGSGSSGLVATGPAALAVFDDGSGPALYVGGEFDEDWHRVAKWTGSGWTTLDKMDSLVDALVVFDDGGGPALYASGNFTKASGKPANRIAKWDGSSWDWTPLGSGMSSPAGSSCSVRALTVHDDGGGPALYAAGFFQSAGGLVVNNVAKWDGASWTPLGTGISGLATTINSVSVLAVFDDGSGPALYAGGHFTTAGGVAASNIARWDGSSWAPLGSGVSGPVLSDVDALTVFDDGSGPALYVAGNFTTAGGVAASNIAMWDGTSWTPLGSGMNGVVSGLTVFDDGTGPSLYAGGAFLSALDSGDSYIAKWGCAASSSVTYCTAGTSAGGCQALLSASGVASSTAPSGFTLSAATVEGHKDGQLFFGTDGRQANPWGNGTSYQCVVPPVKRCGVLPGVGTSGVCDGSFSQDLNAFWCPTCPKPHKNPGPGAVVQAQLWYRDPLSTSNQTTSLSDAIEFVMGL